MDKPKAIPSYQKVNQWVQQYGRIDIPDDRGVQDFMICETTEAVRSLQAELIALADGRYVETTIDALVGKRRKVKYGSYEQWAKLMLQWIVAYKV